MFRDSALDPNTGLPPIEPIELYEKRLEVEAKLAEASQAADADQAKIAAERDEARKELQDGFEQHKAATILAQFTP